MIDGHVRITVSQEVKENWELHRQEPKLYALSQNGLVYCDCDKAAILVPRKDAEFTQWTCFSCIRK